MSKLYCPECNSYLMVGTGDCTDCSCGFKQPLAEPEEGQGCVEADETIRCQQIVLDKIGALLGVEPGDVDGIGVAIESLQKDSARYGFLREYEETFEVRRHKKGIAILPRWTNYEFVLSKTMDESIDKALAAWEANGEKPNR